MASNKQAAKNRAERGGNVYREINKYSNAYRHYHIKRY